MVDRALYLFKVDLIELYSNYTEGKVRAEYDFEYEARVKAINESES